MTGTEALVAYGFTLNSEGRYVRVGKRTQEWEQTADGWFRYDPAESGTERIPLCVDPESPVQNGLDFRQLPEAFVWVWPDEEIARIYGAVTP